MKKKLLVLFLAIAMVFSLAACGSKQAEPEGTDLSSADWDEI